MTIVGKWAKGRAVFLENGATSAPDLSATGAVSPSFIGVAGTSTRLQASSPARPRPIGMD
jgi:hypothetical protein